MPDHTPHPACPPTRLLDQISPAPAVCFTVPSRVLPTSNAMWCCSVPTSHDAMWCCSVPTSHDAVWCCSVHTSILAMMPCGAAACVLGGSQASPVLDQAAVQLLGLKDLRGVGWRGEERSPNRAVSAPCLLSTPPPRSHSHPVGWPLCTPCLPASPTPAFPTTHSHSHLAGVVPIPAVWLEVVHIRGSCCLCLAASPGQQAACQGKRHLGVIRVAAIPAGRQDRGGGGACFGKQQTDTAQKRGVQTYRVWTGLSGGWGHRSA